MMQMSAMLKTEAKPVKDPSKKMEGAEPSEGFFALLDDQIDAPERSAQPQEDAGSFEEEPDTNLTDPSVGELEPDAPMIPSETVFENKGAEQPVELVEQPVGESVPVGEEVPSAPVAESDVLPQLVAGEQAVSQNVGLVAGESLVEKPVKQIGAADKVGEVVAAEMPVDGAKAAAVSQEEADLQVLAGLQSASKTEVEPDVSAKQNLTELMASMKLQKSTQKGEGRSVAEQTPFVVDSASRSSALNVDPKIQVPAPDATLQANQVSEETIRLEALVDRFDQRMLSMVQRNDKVMRITVQPAAMGRLTVLCQQEDSTITVEIHAQNGAVQDLIAQQEDSVRSLMKANELELGKFDVFQDQGSDQQQGSLANPKGKRGMQPATTQEEELQESQSVSHNGALSWIA
jgi:flagellar hook-length control protein FliK